MKFKMHIRGFTLIELLVTIAIIALLSTIVYASFDEARKQARDKARMTTLKELQLAIEQYRAQTGQYPSPGCSGTAVQFVGPGPSTGGTYKSCSGNNIQTYIVGLTPDYIGTLPFDPKFEFETGRGFFYRTDGNSYKLILRDSVETVLVTSFEDEFARCPSAGGGCPDIASIGTTYAVYSAGAEAW